MVNYELYRPKSVLNVQKRADGGWFWTKYSAFPYMGCYYGCEYCYWRDEKYNRLARERPDLEDAFREYIKIKENAPELLKQQLKNKPKDVIYIDSYQPIESKHRLARKMLQVCLELNLPVFINEKSPLVLKDLNLLKKLSSNYLNIGWSIVFSKDDSAKQHFESRAPTIKSRFQAMKTLSNAGIFTGTVAMPVLPFICDSEDNIKELVKKTKHNGGSYVLDAGLTLWGYCGAHFYKYLKSYNPSLVPKYKRIYADPKLLSQTYKETHNLFKKYCKEYKILNHIPRPKTETFNQRIAEHFYIKSRETMMTEGSGYKQFAYLKTAWNIDALTQDVRKIYEEQGRDGLIRLPGIGEKISLEIINFLKSHGIE